MRTYGQHCVIAKALDVVGDRWTLLIVRELMLQGPCRFTDLRNGLPGIATNLLSTRLKELEEAGLIYREAAPPPVATTLFHLTDDGLALDPVLESLGQWGVRYSVTREPDEVFRTHWLSYPLRWLLLDNHPRRPAQTIQLDSEGESLVLDISAGTISPRRGPIPDPDALVSGDPDLILALLTGLVDADSAGRAGLDVRGDRNVLARIRPSTPPAELTSALAARGGAPASGAR